LRRHDSELRALLVNDANLAGAYALVDSHGRAAISPVSEALS
jgi:hypothetical protein